MQRGLVVAAVGAFVVGCGAEPPAHSPVRAAIGQQVQSWVREDSKVNDWSSCVGAPGEGASIVFLDFKSQVVPASREALRTSLERRVQQAISAHGEPQSLTGSGMLDTTPTPSCSLYESAGFRGAVFLWVGATEKGQTMVTLAMHELR